MTDAEFPFKSSVLSSGDCRVHFVLVVQAINRSFTNGFGDWTQIGVRIITERDGRVISNALEGPLFLGVDESFVKDVNGDGVPDYVLIGSDQTQSIYLWSITGDCAVENIGFEREHRRWKYNEGDEVFLVPAKGGRGYTIHTRSGEPVTKDATTYRDVTETVYEWDRLARVYRPAREFRRLENDQ